MKRARSVTIHVDADIIDALDRQAARESRSRSNAAEVLIAEGLERRGVKIAEPEPEPRAA